MSSPSHRDGCPIQFSRNLILLAFGCLFLSASSQAALPDRSALPPDALALLKRLPGETLSIDLVLSLAMKTSDSFRIVRSQMISVPVAELRSEAALDPRITLTGGRIIDKNEPINPFSPSNLTASQASISFSKYFVTGTQAEASLTAQDTRYAFDNPGVPGTRGVESAASVKLSQNLWKDRFGSATRAALEAGEKSREASEKGFEESAETWALQLIDLYYQALTLQAQVRAAEDGLARQKRMHDITRLKTKRGTAEKPDLLQTEEAVLQAEITVKDARQALGVIWRELVTALKMPNSWLQIDPMLVPIELDDPIPAAMNACGPAGGLKAAPSSDSTTRKAGLQAEAARLQAESALGLAKPTLALQGGLTSNGVDGTKLSPTFSKTFSAENPEWSAQLTFSMPLWGSAEEADVRDATAMRERAEAQASMANGDLVVGWINHCTNLHRLRKIADDLRDAVKSQGERVKLEEERFRIGRVQTLNVIQAGDAATRTELSFIRTAAALRQTAWKVARLEGRVTNYLKRLTEKPVELKP